MTKRVLDVGNCVPDHASICRLIETNFDARVLQAHGPEDALSELRKGGVDLVLVNRKLDRDYSDGLDIIQQIKQDPEIASTPCMLITNYAEHQEVAMQAGAERGFGKQELASPATRTQLTKFLA